MKVGELLVGEGLITPIELEEALKCQVIFGGRLGTNLIELGLLDEEELARTLSRKLGLPWVDPPELLMEVPPDVLALIPADFAERYKVIPLRFENRRLTLAMLNPSDLRAVEEISFATGLIIRPVIAPEVRLLLALEKHYDIPRKIRYVPVTRMLRSRRKSPPSPEPSPPSPFEGYLCADAEETAPFPADVALEPEAEAPEEAPCIDAAGSEDSFLKGLTEARNRDEVANLLVGHLGREYGRAALFLIREGTAFGWKGMSRGKALEDFDRARIPLTDASVVKAVAEKGGYYLGPVPPGANASLLQAMGGEVPGSAVLLPLLLAGRIVGILYLDDKGDLGPKLDSLRRLAAKGVMALEILILKNKILMT